MDRRAADSETWPSIVEALRAEVTRQQFETWFRPMRLVREAGGRFEFSVPNPFLKDWIEGFYLGLLGRTADAETWFGQEVSSHPESAHFVDALRAISLAEENPEREREDEMESEVPQ